MAKRLTVEAYVEGILNKNIPVLSQAISLIESKKTEDQNIAQEVLLKIFPFTGKSKRIGITGSPGVGKSTFIEHFGQIIAHQHALAVLTIDPSSPISKGSILGDKTRMYELSQKHNVYIRSTASGNSLGGVAEATYDTLLLCEAAGFEVIIIESVGVGQTETLIHQLVDCFILLILGNSGDELQGIKKGIMEMADIIVVTKADKKNRQLAIQSKVELLNAIKLFHHSLNHWKIPVEICSALENYNLDKIWNITRSFFDLLSQHQLLEHWRYNKRKSWFYHEIERIVLQTVMKSPQFLIQLKKLENQLDNHPKLHFEEIQKIQQWLQKKLL